MKNKYKNNDHMTISGQGMLLGNKVKMSIKTRLEMLKHQQKNNQTVISQEPENGWLVLEANKSRAHTHKILLAEIIKKL